MPSARSTTSSAARVEANSTSWRPRASQSGRADASGEVEDSGIPFVDPRRRHRADQLLEHLGASAVRVDEGEDHLGVDRHLGLVPGDAVTNEQLVIVLDDPVVDPDDAPVTNGVVVRRDRRMPLGVVADVDERLLRRRGEDDRVEHRARAASAACGRRADRPRGPHIQRHPRLARRSRPAVPEPQEFDRSATRCRRCSLRFRTCELVSQTYSESREGSVRIVGDDSSFADASSGGRAQPIRLSWRRMLRSLSSIRRARGRTTSIQVRPFTIR